MVFAKELDLNGLGFLTVLKRLFIIKDPVIAPNVSIAPCYIGMVLAEELDPNR
jgi:hypothetical protein